MVHTVVVESIIIMNSNSSAIYVTDFGYSERGFQYIMIKNSCLLALGDRVELSFLFPAYGAHLVLT